MTAEEVGASIAGVGIIGGALRIFATVWRWRRTLAAISMLIEEYMAAKAPTSDGGSKVTSYEAEYLIQRIAELVTEGVRAKTPVPQELTEDAVPIESDKEPQ